MNRLTDPSALPLLEALLRQEWSLLGCPLAWASLLALADEHRVAPLLFHNLKQAGQLPRLPPTWADRLLTCFQESALRNALYHTSLEAIVILLNQIGIEPILLKGAALAYAIYPHPALRPMGDLDLWVAPHHFAAAANAFARAGWRPTLPGQWPLIQAGISHHLGLANPSGFPRSLELHRHWMALPTLLRHPDAEALVWQNSQPVAIGQARARLLAPIDHFIYLAAHLARHAAHQDRLIWYVDLAILAETQRRAFDWPRLPIRAAQLGLTAPLAWVPDRVVQRLALPIPTAVQEDLRSIQPNATAAAFFAPPEAEWQHVRLERAWRMWWGLTHWKDRLLWARELILPRPVLLARLYPQDGKAMRLLRYPQRWIDYGLKLVGLALSGLSGHDK